MNAESGKVQADRAKRKALLTTATLVEDGGRSVEVRVRNLSQTGLGGVASDPLVTGTVYTVALKGIGEIEGQIVWANGTRFGMHFTDQIKLEALEMSDIGKLVPRQDAEFYRTYQQAPEHYRRPPLRSR